MIEPINKPNVKFSYYTIVGKLMQNFSRGECTLYTISVVKAYVQGMQLNWCRFLIHELYDACEDVCGSVFVAML